MRTLRNVLWLLVLIVLVVFSIDNWTDVHVRIWEDIMLDTKLPALVILAFLAGLVPMWLVARAGRWRLQRRITTLENAVRAASPGAPPQTLSDAEVHPED